MEQVLVLNVNYEPINICGMRRAVGLLLCDKASMVINGRGYIYTIGNTFPRPSVIRLKYLVKRPHPQVKLTRQEILRRDNFTCQYCGKKTKSLTLDHVYPKHLGGLYTWSNLVAACPACNHRKGGRTLKEANMTLLKKPVMPPNSIEYIYGHYLNQFSDWKPFIENW